MANLLALPAELRQNILALLLPDINILFKPWPRSIRDLLHISTCLRDDMGPVISTWSPLHHIPNPRELAKFRAQTIRLDNCIRTPRIERICLDLFDESDLNRILQTCFCQGDHAHSHPELIAAWMNAVELLPKNINSVFLDITPAPASKKNQHRVVINAFVHDKRPARNFLLCHIQDVSALIRAIDKHYDGQIPIALTGVVSTKSRFYVQRLQMDSECDLDFVGTWVTAEQAQYKKIDAAVDKLASKKHGNPALYQHLKYVEWSKETKWTYAKVADAGEGEGVDQDLRMIAEFIADEERDALSMQPAENLRRAMQHDIARDIGFKSQSDGDGPDRHVVIRRNLDKLDV